MTMEIRYGRDDTVWVRTPPDDDGVCHTCGRSGADSIYRKGVVQKVVATEDHVGVRIWYTIATISTPDAEPTMLTAIQHDVMPLSYMGDA